MASQGVFPARPAARLVEARPRAKRPGRPRYALGDFPALLWRERWLMVAAFLGVTVVGLAFALTLKTAYAAHSSVLVRLGQDYDNEPRAGDAGRGAAPDSDHLMLSESEIIASDPVRARVVSRLGIARLAPNQARAFAAASSAGRERMLAELAARMGRSLKVETAPDTPVIRLSYDDSDPARAALVLDTLLEEYLAYRRAMLDTPTAGAIDDQRRAFEQRLADADARYQSLRASNRIGDFEAERSSLSQLSAQIDVLASNVRDFTQEAERSQASPAIAAAADDNIRIVERAALPVTGQSLRKPVMALSVVFALFSAGCAGLARLYLRPGLPTPAAASRTLDLPVLGAAALKQPA